MTYREATSYLESFVNYEKIPSWAYRESLKLRRLKDFLAAIGNPQNDLKCIHIAGTKGKGSTCAFIAYILREAGFKTGLYTSPHLQDFRERIRILPKDKEECGTDFAGVISRKDLTALVKKIKPAVERRKRNSPYGQLSFFEVYTALAFVYFKEKDVDFAVLETGMGGRLDATNAAWPLVCGFSPISYEHTQNLGSTLRAIAAEKAGIIKPDQLRRAGFQPLAVSALQNKEVMGVIRQRCVKTGVKLYEVGRDIKFQKTKEGFKLRGIFGRYKDLQARLLGAHQIINAATALGVIEALRFHNITIREEAVRRGFKNACWPGRFEIIARKPLIILDGAQNIASAKALRSTVKEYFPHRPLCLVLGISQDKDIKGICAQLIPLSSRIILTQADNPRAASVDFLWEVIFKNHPDMGVPIHKTRGVKEVLALLKHSCLSKELILVCGSLFVVGEFRSLWLENNRLRGI